MDEATQLLERGVGGMVWAVLVALGILAVVWLGTRLDRLWIRWRVRQEARRAARDAWRVRLTRHAWRGRRR